jgi:dihydroorotase
MNKIKLNTPLDMHLHIRDGEMMKNVLPFSSSVFSGALIMPNLQPPITSKELLLNTNRFTNNSCKVLW